MKHKKEFINLAIPIVIVILSAITLIIILINNL